MKTFNRTNLPKEIKYNNKIYKRGDRTENSIQVNVLSMRLRSEFYQPSIHYFNPID